MQTPSYVLVPQAAHRQMSRPDQELLKAVVLDRLHIQLCQII